MDIRENLEGNLKALRQEQARNFVYRLEQEGIKVHDRGVPVYKYVSVKRAKEILNNRSIFFASCHAFNDPFEFHDALLAPNYEETIDTLKANQIKEAGPNMSQAAIDKFMAEADSMHNEMKSKLKNIFEKAKSNLGIFCASKSHTNTLLWSHYGDSHKGVCLGFHLKPVEADPEYTYLNVAYKDSIKPVLYDFLHQDEAHFPFMYWMHIKSRVWEYEQEIRIMNFRRNGVLPIDNMEIKEIYYGVATPIAEVEELETIIALKRYDIAKRGKMRISKSTFDLEIVNF